MPLFLILCLKSRDNFEPWPLMVFLLPPEEIVCQGASAIYNNSGSEYSHCYCSASSLAYNFFRRKKKGHEWPRLKIISASKAENKERWHLLLLLEFLTIILLLLLWPISKVIYYYYYYSKGYYYYYLMSYCV